MGGMPLGTGNFTPMQSAMAQQAATNINLQMQAAAMASGQNFDRESYERAMKGYILRGMDAKSVASTAASRVQKAEWEMEYDRKDREVDEMIERHRQERERVRIEEEGDNVPRGED